MKRTTFIILALAASFGFGFGFKTIITRQSDNQPNMKKVTGIGGIFFKCKVPKKYEKSGKQLGSKTTK